MLVCLCLLLILSLEYKATNKKYRYLFDDFKSDINMLMYEQIYEEDEWPDMRPFKHPENNWYKRWEAAKIAVLNNLVKWKVYNIFVVNDKVWSWVFDGEHMLWNIDIEKLDFAEKRYQFRRVKWV